MTVKEFIYQFGKVHGLSQADIAEQCGRSKGNLCKSLNNEYGMNMKLKTFVDLLDQVECQMVIEDLNTIDDEYIIDGEYEGCDSEE